MIFGSLVLLTLISVAATFLPLPGVEVDLILLAIALLMTSLVGFQYMGLKREGRLVRWAVVVPLVLFAILLIVLLLDSTFRPGGFGSPSP